MFHEARTDDYGVNSFSSIRNISWLYVEPLSYCLQHRFMNYFERIIFLDGAVCDALMFEVSISSAKPCE